MTEDTSAKSIKILLVDDHPLVRKAIRRSLNEQSGFSFTEASRLDEAKHLVETRQFDLVLLDLYLFGEYGGELVRTIRCLPLFHDTPILVVSGESNAEDMVRVMALGASDFLLKPFKDGDLRKKILTLLKKSLTPDSYTASKRYAEHAISRNNIKGALVHIESCKKLKPASVYPRYLEGLAEERLGNSETALKIYEECIRRENNFYFARAAIVRLAILNEDHDTIKHHLKTELEQNPQQPDKQVVLGNILLRDGMLDQAKEHFTDALKGDSRYLSALFGMADVQSALGDIDKSVYYLKRIRRYFRENSKCLLKIVEVCLAADKPDIAENALRDEITTNKMSLDSYAVLAKFYLTRNRATDATKILESACLINPYNYSILKILFSVFASRNETSKISIHFKNEPKDYSHKTVASAIKVLSEYDMPSITYDFLIQNFKKWKEPDRVKKYFLKMTLKNHEYGKAYYLALSLGIAVRTSHSLSHAVEMLDKRRLRIGGQEAA